MCRRTWKPSLRDAFQRPPRLRPGLGRPRIRPRRRLRLRPATAAGTDEEPRPGSVRRHGKPPEAGFGAEWIARSLTAQTGGLRPERGLFRHPAPGATVEQDVWVRYGFTGTGMRIFPTQDRWAVPLTDKLSCTRDRQPPTGIRNAFRQEAFA